MFPASLPGSPGGGSSPLSSLTGHEDECKNPWRFVPIAECPPEIAARRRVWQHFFNARRGGELLTEKGSRIAENIAIGFLVDHYTDAQLAAIDDFVTHKIFPYKQPERIGLTTGFIIREQAQNAREVLKRAGDWPPDAMSREVWEQQHAPKAPPAPVETSMEKYARLRAQFANRPPLPPLPKPPAHAPVAV